MYEHGLVRALLTPKYDIIKFSQDSLRDAIKPLLTWKKLRNSGKVGFILKDRDDHVRKANNGTRVFKRRISAGGRKHRALFVIRLIAIENAMRFSLLFIPHTSHPQAPNLGPPQSISLHRTSPQDPSAITKFAEHLAGHRII